MTNRAREQQRPWLRNAAFLLALTTASQSYGTDGQADAPAAPATPPTEQPADASADADADASPDNDAGDASAEETPTPAESEAPAETPQPEEPAVAEEAPTASDAEEEPAATDPGAASNRYYLLAGIAALLVVLAVLVRLVARNRRQSRSAAAEPEANGQTTFGYFYINEAGHQRIYNLSADVINVGRSASNDLVLSNDTVSASHLVVKRERNGGVLVTDLNSSNGTRINGEEVSRAMLVPGDALELGDVLIRFETRAPASPGDMTRQVG